MEDVVVDVGVDVFRIDEEAVYVEDAGADWGEIGIVRVGCRHGCREILNMKLWLCGSLNKCEGVAGWMWGFPLSCAFTFLIS